MDNASNTDKSPTTDTVSKIDGTENIDTSDDRLNIATPSQLAQMINSTQSESLSNIDINSTISTMSAPNKTDYAFTQIPETDDEESNNETLTAPTQIIQIPDKKPRKSLKSKSRFRSSRNTKLKSLEQNMLKMSAQQMRNTKAVSDLKHSMTNFQNTMNNNNNIMTELMQTIKHQMAKPQPRANDNTSNINPVNEYNNYNHNHNKYNNNYHNHNHNNYNNHNQNQLNISDQLNTNDQNQNKEEEQKQIMIKSKSTDKNEMDHDDDDVEIISNNKN